LSVNIAVIILAAGLSTRMGEQKLLLPLGEQPVLAHVLATAAKLGCQHCVAVIGEPRDQLAQLCAHYNIPSVYNPDRRSGQASSLRTGLACLPVDIDGILFILGDQPYISDTLLQALIDTFANCGDPHAIIVPCYQGQSYSPVLFGAAWRDELSALAGDQGGRVLLQQYPQCITRLEWTDPAAFCDIDTPQAYQELLQNRGK
jgi:molybdenum cofactor cytidylyltransferase